MSHATALQAPTSSLPRLRGAHPDDATQATIAAALRSLTAIYCPLSRATKASSSSAPQPPTTLLKNLSSLPASSGTSTPATADSGYASGDDDDACPCPEQDLAAALRADDYERHFATRWLTTFLARGDELLPAMDDAVRQRFIDEASYILASFSSATDAEDEDDGGAIVRQFRFAVAGQENAVVEVQLTDGTPATGADHTDVGLQSWGASIVVSDLMCSTPQAFGLSADALGPAPRIVELGAGTGLVGITLAKLLPRLGVPAARIVATDYHPAVLGNLRANIAANFPEAEAGVVKTCLLDWAAPCLEALRDKADMLVATDVVYAPEHAGWLRDCAARMLAPEGVFWLVASVRPNGRFEGVTDTVEGAFAVGACCPLDDGVVGRRALRILSKEMVEKRRGVGRGDEIGYKIFRIGWAEI